jgi:hypothetical protein
MKVRLADSVPAQCFPEPRSASGTIASFLPQSFVSRYVISLMFDCDEGEQFR